MHARLFTLALVATALAAPPALADAPRLHHVPVAELPPGSIALIAATIDHGWDGRVELRYRTLGDAEWHAAVFDRVDGDRYVATLPASAARPPGLEYFIASPGHAHFASAEAPHRVYVFEDPDAALRARELARADGRRARVRLAAELVDFGTRTITDTRTGAEHRVSDRYYRLDADFSYRVLRFPLRALRFGFTRLIGTTPVTGRGDGPCAERAADPCERAAGFRAGGWAELRWRVTDVVGLDTRALIQATPSGFGFGGRAELRFGDDFGSHVALGGEAISEVGTTAYVRLGWDTVPRLPMAATIELSDYPSSHRDPAVRLLYDLSYDTGIGLRVGGRVGYQARDEGIGGATGGVHASLDF